MGALQTFIDSYKTPIGRDRASSTSIRGGNDVIGGKGGELKYSANNNNNNNNNNSNNNNNNNIDNNGGGDRVRALTKQGGDSNDLDMGGTPRRAPNKTRKRDLTDVMCDITLAGLTGSVTHARREIGTVGGSLTNQTSSSTTAHSEFMAEQTKIQLRKMTATRAAEMAMTASNDRRNVLPRPTGSDLAVNLRTADPNMATANNKNLWKQARAIAAVDYGSIRARTVPILTTRNKRYTDSFAQVPRWGELEQFINDLVVANYAHETIACYQDHWAKYVHICLQMLWDPRRTTPSIPDRLLMFVAHWSKHILLAPSYLLSTVSGIKWTLRFLKVPMPTKDQLTGVSNAISGYKREWIKVFGPPPVPCRPTKAMVLAICRFAREDPVNKIQDVELRELIIALIGMQTSLSLRPGHIWYPGSNKPHQLCQVAWLYKMGADIRAVSTYREPANWSETPIGISIRTTAKNLREATTISAAAINAIPVMGNGGRSAALDDTDRELLSELDDDAPDEAFQHMTDEDDCLVTPLWTILKTYPPIEGQHFLSGIPQRTLGLLTSTVKKLLIDFSASTTGVQNLTLKCFRSVIITMMCSVGHSRDECREQGKWSSVQAMEKFYLTQTFTGHQMKAVKAYAGTPTIGTDAAIDAQHQQHHNAPVAPARVIPQPAQNEGASM